MSRGVIQRFLKSLPSSSCLRVFDVNFRQQFYDFTLIQKSLKFANLLKLSDEELPVLASVFKLSDSNMTICQNIDETIRFTPNCTDSRKARRHLNFKRPRSANAKEFRWRLELVGAGGCIHSSNDYRAVSKPPFGNHQLLCLPCGSFCLLSNRYSARYTR